MIFSDKDAQVPEKKGFWLCSLLDLLYLLLCADVAQLVERLIRNQ